jgi:hypothetical protein
MERQRHLECVGTLSRNNVIVTLQCYHAQVLNYTMRLQVFCFDFARSKRAELASLLRDTRAVVRIFRLVCREGQLFHRSWDRRSFDLSRRVSSVRLLYFYFE